MTSITRDVFVDGTKVQIVERDPNQAASPRWAVSQLYLGDDALQALKIAEPLKPGTMVALNCVAKVVSAELREDQKGESENCMSIQIVDMDLAPQAKTVDAKAFYPTMKE